MLSGEKLNFAFKQLIVLKTDLYSQNILTLYYQNYVDAQSAGAVEYTDCTSAKK